MKERRDGYEGLNKCLHTGQSEVPFTDTVVCLMVLSDGSEDEANGELGDSVRGVRWNGNDFETEGFGFLQVDIVRASALDTLSDEDIGRTTWQLHRNMMRTVRY